jgi:hypothetical protein
MFMNFVEARTKDLTKESIKRRIKRFKKNISCSSDGVTYMGEAKTSIEIMLPVNKETNIN